MIRRRLLLVLTGVVLSPALSRAQQAPILYSNGREAREASEHKLYEDVEIFRRILNGKLSALYPRNVNANAAWIDLGMIANPAINAPIFSPVSQGPYSYPTMPNSPSAYFQYLSSPTIAHLNSAANRPQRSDADSRPSKAEGVYLKGQGVVFTVTVSSLQPTASAESGSVAGVLLRLTRAPTEWENVRRQVRNEKEEPKKPEAAKPPKLSDVLLKLLAENGHHFAQLGENESLTIVVTVHEKKDPKSEEAPSKKGLHEATDRVDPDKAAKVRDLELLGDLHLKQGKVDEAVAIYRKALDVNPGLKQAEAISRKLAQAYLILEQNEKAQAALNQSIALAARRRELAGAKEKQAPAPKSAAVSLPIKLIVSAPKKLLDEAKEGKMTAEEFRRRAHVETLTFDDEHH